MKTIKIPANVRNPYTLNINGVKYSYPAGETVAVPDDVAEAILNALALEPVENPPKEGDVWKFESPAGAKWDTPVLVDDVPTEGSANAVSSGGTWQAIENVKPTSEELETLVENILEEHPEWTTTVEDGAITAAKLAPNAVETAKINNGAVTADKLAANAVVTAKIADGAVTSDKLASAVTEVIAAKAAASDLTALIGRLESGAEEDAELHLGFYLDENGDLCQVDSN